jgi:hypothetical protein
VAQVADAVIEAKIRLWVSGVCILMAMVGERNIRKKKEKEAIAYAQSEVVGGDDFSNASQLCHVDPPHVATR